MNAIYQKNYNLLKAKFKFYTQGKMLCDLSMGQWQGKQPPLKHTNHSISHSWKQPYSSPLIHINLHDLHSAEQINYFQQVLVRDGLFPILDFFNRHPDPKFFKPIFIFHKNFADYIPIKWQRNVLFYDFAFLPESKLMQHFFAHDSLLIKGIYNYNVFDLEKLEYLLSTSMNFKNIFLSLNLLDNPFLNKKWEGNSLLYDFSKTIDNLKRKFPNFEKIELITYEQLFKIKNLNEFKFVDLNKKFHYYSDEYLNFYLIKNGAIPHEVELIPKPQSTSGHLVRITPLHGVFIHENCDFKENSLVENLNQEIEELHSYELTESYTIDIFNLIDQRTRFNQPDFKFFDLRI